MPPFAYDEVPYEDYPVTETHVDALYLGATAAGLDAARPEGARILELGCAHAVNLMPMAFHLPGATLMGMDLSAAQIDRARARAEALGLRNLELRQGDVMDLELGERRFDYVIAHGLYSWVPEPVRARVLAVCHHALAPAGVAYVSYNAMPAWGIRGAIARALTEGVDPDDPPPKRIRRARAVLARLEQVQPLKGTAEGALLRAEIEGLRDKPDAYLLHEYLVPCNRAFYLREMVERAERAGLRWLGDVAPSGMPPAEHRRARHALRSLHDDELVVEQLLDIVGFRQFRASLFHRADAPRGPRLTPVQRLHQGVLAAPPREPAPDDPPAARDALERLGQRWPRDAPLAELARDASLPPDALAEALVEPLHDERLRLRPRALPIAPLGERPRVAALTRFEAAHLPFVTTPMHEHAPLDSFHAALVGHLDGRHTRATLVDVLARDIEAGRLPLASGAPPPPDRLRAALASMIDAGLTGLHQAGLLVP